MSTDVDNFLAHYGVKGMKWGVRKAPGEKSNHRITLEGKYIKKGLTVAEAEVAADRRIKVEKTIAIVGATTVAAALAYSAGRIIGRDYLDVKLKAGTPLQHVTEVGDMELKNLPLFTTFTKGDKKNIHGLFPMPNQINLETTKSITAPSNYKARKMLAETLGKKRLSKSEYARFNYRYFYNQDEPANKRVVDEFFGKIKSAGYNSVLDPKPGGYRGPTGNIKRLHKPLIVLDATGAVRKTGEQRVGAIAQAAAEKRLLIKEVAASASTFTGLTALLTGAAATSNSREQVNAIDSYFSKNPTSTYSRSEVASMIRTSNGKYVVKAPRKKN